ncbi:TRAP transporter small permease [Dysosmobacter sp.]|uniref:TRAP transporter small permease n=1 Tax=Dysosmobacter sp. TaxID=2591382 RepID=UPI002A8C8ABB|nr:TRAP transporter small permease [Dysosmobacter sp.]MDY3282360.1 TRAP transporter small permease [Dysosmobacter sp.]
MYDRIMKKMSEVMLLIAAISLILTITVNAVEIFRRFAFNASFYWIQDVTLLGMMWFIFPGMVMISYKGTDVYVDIFISRFPPKIREIVQIVNDVMVMAICSVLFYYSCQLLILRLGKSMLTSEIPYFWYTLAMVIVFLQLALVYFGKILKSVQKKRSAGGEAS